jgi:hypothetical protein
MAKSLLGRPARKALGAYDPMEMVGSGAKRAMKELRPEFGLADFNPADSDVLGSGMALRRMAPDYSPIATAVSVNARGRSTPQPNPLMGSPVQPAPGMAPARAASAAPIASAMGPPPPTQPQQPQPPSTFDPQAQPPAPDPQRPYIEPLPPPGPNEQFQPGYQPDPLPGTSGPYDPSRLNYEGQTYQGPPVQGTGSVTNAPTEDQLRQIQEFMDSTGIKLNKDWRKKLAADPAGFIAELRATKAVPSNNLPRMADFLQKLLSGTQTTTDPKAASQYYDQANYNQALTRLRQAGVQGAREDEESVLGELQSRGLLNSGIAARELARMREGRSQNFRQAAARLNEILFSNASDQAKREAITRLQAELELGNQETLMRLKYSLQEDYEAGQNRNDFMSFLTRIAGGAIGAAVGGPVGAIAGGLYGGGGNQGQQILDTDVTRA